MGFHTLWTGQWSGAEALVVQTLVANTGFDHRIFMAYIKSIFLLIWTLTLVKNNLMEILPSSFHKSINYLLNTTNFLKAAGASLASRSSLTLKV